MLEAHILLGHSSNQEPRSPTHTWHLQVLSLQRIGFRSHSLIHSESLIRFSEMSLTTYFLLFTHISWRNPYLDSIMRLPPTIEVSVQQNVHPDLPPDDSAKRESDSSSYSMLHSLNWSGIRRSPPPFQDEFTSIQSRPFPRPIFPKCCFAQNTLAQLLAIAEQ